MVEKARFILRTHRIYRNLIYPAFGAIMESLLTRCCVSRGAVLVSKRSAKRRRLWMGLIPLTVSDSYVCCQGDSIISLYITLASIPHGIDYYNMRESDIPPIPCLSIWSMCRHRSILRHTFTKYSSIIKWIWPRQVFWFNVACLWIWDSISMTSSSKPTQT